MKCTNCGAENKIGNEFCTNCGAELENEVYSKELYTSEVSKPTSKNNKNIIIIVIAAIVVIAAIAATVIVLTSKDKKEEPSTTVSVSQQEQTQQETEDAEQGNEANVQSDSNVTITSVKTNEGFASVDAKVSNTGYTAKGEDVIEAEGLCICGTYTYESDIDTSKIEGHGGTLLDSNENEIDKAAFFSDWNNKEFYVDLSEDIAAGKYTAEVYQFEGDKYISFTIEFSVN